jgi:DNA-binding MurR/RpiR family transcriptional regulator
MEETFAELGDDENIFAKLIKRDIQLLQETLQAASFPDFHKAVEIIWRAQKVFIIVSMLQWLWPIYFTFGSYG